MAATSSESVLLHVLVKGEFTEGVGAEGGNVHSSSPLKTVLRGYFFLEPVENYNLNTWRVLSWSNNLRRGKIDKSGHLFSILTFSISFL